MVGGGFNPGCLLLSATVLVQLLVCESRCAIGQPGMQVGAYLLNCYQNLRRLRAQVLRGA